MQQQILLHVIYHLNPHDGSRTAGFPTCNLHLWLDRLEWVFDPVVLGVPGYGPPCFDDGLRTPGDQP